MATAGGSAQMDRTRSILVGLVSTSSWLDWTWLASNQVQMDLVSALLTGTKTWPIFGSEISRLNQAWAKVSKTVEKMTKRFLLRVQLSLWFSPRGRVICVVDPVHTIH